MRAKLVMENYDSDYEELELIVSPNHSIDELINIIQVSNEMLLHHKKALPHSSNAYKKAKIKSMEYLETIHHLNKNEIEDLIDDKDDNVNESFTALLWAKKHLPAEVAEDIEKTLDGEFGEELTKKLLKASNNKEDLISWYNKNFEIGEIR